MDKVFIDTNILIYATDKGSEFYQNALEKLNKLFLEGNTLFISGQVIREYVKVTSEIGKLSLKEIIENINFFQNHFAVLFENETTILLLKNLVMKYKIKGRNVFDCNITATMMSNNIKHILTHNVKDFSIYNEIIVTPLLK